ncbi:Periplasmic solute binding protein, ZnuA-like [Acididesulfobacillus acetoxydans]|uniref:ABC-type metal ion transporter, periplasmic subunit n=1 Tax=Acididesulfobacillus acetoxydans TaxID=1561005 RepID=A0A8S0WPJ9_9FIRM|nr:Periplasmic solute binding protein, ZnuA-like [Acididesulfobacillus acetoxydans]CEJ08182.1 ABC-type metal ion transporter, periplasmic subunit [Acididesulfobacillus acetoxydans]
MTADRVRGERVKNKRVNTNMKDDDLSYLKVVRKTGVQGRRVEGRGVLLAILVALTSISLLGGCGTQSPTAKVTPSTREKSVLAVGAENEYADVIRQIGGKYVSVTAIMSDPSVDPHSYEADTRDASIVSKATLIVQNGLGYDDFMNKLEAGSPHSGRVVIDVAQALGYSENTANPHLWYKPETMPKVAAPIAKDLERQLPSEKPYFEDQLTKFNDSLKTWHDDLNQLHKAYGNTGVAVTEPVADYMLEAAQLQVKTPWGFQAAVMNGTDPSPQDVKIQQNLLIDKQVKVLIYNQQAVDSATTALLQLAKRHGIPVVGVYETMPPNHTYQTWMEDEATNLLKALKSGVSTETLK